MSFTFDTTPGPAIHRAARRLKQALSSQLKSFDITPEQFSVLTRLWGADGLIQRQRAERLQQDKANVTRILDRLAAKGLIERSADHDDRRTFRVVLTGAGRAAENVLRVQVEELRACAYADLSLPERERLIAAAAGRGRE